MTDKPTSESDPAGTSTTGEQPKEEVVTESQPSAETADLSAAVAGDVNNGDEKTGDGKNDEQEKDPDKDESISDRGKRIAEDALALGQKGMVASVRQFLPLVEGYGRSMKRCGEEIPKGEDDEFSPEEKRVLKTAGNKLAYEIIELSTKLYPAYEGSDEYKSDRNPETNCYPAPSLTHLVSVVRAGSQFLGPDNTAMSMLGAAQTGVEVEQNPAQPSTQTTSNTSNNDLTNLSGGQPILQQVNATPKQIRQQALMLRQLEAQQALVMEGEPVQTRSMAMMQQAPASQSNQQPLQQYSQQQYSQKQYNENGNTTANRSSAMKTATNRNTSMGNGRYTQSPASAVPQQYSSGCSSCGGSSQSYSNSYSNSSSNSYGNVVSGGCDCGCNGSYGCGQGSASSGEVARYDEDGNCENMFSISCETRWRMRDCFKNFFCDVLYNISDGLCENGHPIQVPVYDDYGQPVYDQNGQPETESPDFGDVLGDSLKSGMCGLIQCLPDAICGPRGPTTPGITNNTDCGFAVEGGSNVYK